MTGRKWVAAGALVALILLGARAGFAADDSHPRVAFETSMGTIVFELDPEHAPASVANFLRYVAERHFDGTVFYRVVPGFVIEAGSFDAEGKGRAVHDPIPLEANNGLKNVRGAISMAHGDDPNSARAEFFIVLADNPGLDQAADDHDNKTGYAVFGHVVEGMDVVDKIAAVPTGGTGPFPGEAPVTPVVINKASLVSDVQPAP
jgi:cyclophilin family peptidyl-prolyl cis-trans isomerase